MDLSTEALANTLQWIDRDRGANADRLKGFFELVDGADNIVFRMFLLEEALCRLHTHWNQIALTVEYSKLYRHFVAHACKNSSDLNEAEIIASITSRFLVIGAYESAKEMVRDQGADDERTSYLLEELTEAAEDPNSELVMRGGRSIRRPPARRDIEREPGKWFVLPVGVVCSRERDGRNKGNPYTRYNDKLSQTQEFATINVSVPEERELRHTQRDRRAEQHKKDWEAIDPVKNYLVRRLDLEQHTFKTLKELTKAHSTKVRPVVIFVHGYAQSVADACFHCAQLVADASIDCDLMAYCWPTNDYFAACAYTGSGLAIPKHNPPAVLSELLTEVSAAKSRPVWLVGHSLGCRLILQTLEYMSSRQLKLSSKVSHVILGSPDVPVANVSGLIENAFRFTQHLTLFASTNDRALYGAEKLPFSKSQGYRVGRQPADYGADSVCIDTSTCPDRRPTRYRHSDFTESYLSLSCVKARLAGDSPDWQPPYLSGSGGLLEILSS